MDTNNANADILSVILQPLPVAYVRPVITDKGKHYAVCSTDGTQLALFATEDGAFYAAKQHELEPVLLN